MNPASLNSPPIAGNVSTMSRIHLERNFEFGLQKSVHGSRDLGIYLLKYSWLDAKFLTDKSLGNRTPCRY